MERLLTVRELSERTGIPQSSLYRAAAEGQIPCVRYGRRALRFVEASIDDWTQRQLKSGAGRGPEAGNAAVV